LSPAQRNRSAALKASGYEDGPALTVQSTDGEIPQGRELSFAWLAGTVMTGLTSVLLMGAALYVSFQGQDTFSTAYEALQIVTPEEPEAPVDLVAKQDRVRPIAQTRSEKETIEASVKQNVEGRDIIRMTEFVRIRATLATAATDLSANVPAYDPQAFLEETRPIENDTAIVNTDVYGADVEGEVSIKQAAMPLTLVPPRAISDQSAAEFVRLTVEGAYYEAEPATLSYASTEGTSLRELGIDSGLATSIAENVSVMPKSPHPLEAGRSEKILTMPEDRKLIDILTENDVDTPSIDRITAVMKNLMPALTAPKGARIRILFGTSRNLPDPIVYRLSIYLHEDAMNTDRHAVTVALSDEGAYVIGAEPAKIEFPKEDAVAVDFGNLPSIYRSIWETARKQGIDDQTIPRIIGMFAYDVEMEKTITPGDSIEILQTPPDADGKQELLYVALHLGDAVHELFRFRTDEGTVDFYDPSGETGKRFLTRRPLQGGGRLASRFGMRNHPIFKSRRNHAGIDLAAPRGTPIYASGDGIIEKAQWVSGYGRFVQIQHVNGYETAYGHMNGWADGMKPGVKVRQGQVIGYVGSTGYSTGNHLHFEIRINGRPQDPLSVILPKDKSLDPKYEQQFLATVEQIRELMEMDPAPMAPEDVTVASVN
jgi:murein DD-endopeptidase MepM/ murein hydrolase activator NlpD